jgi:hypothetical protein
MTAGHNALRGSGPGQKLASCRDWSLRLRADVTGLRPDQPIYSLLLEYVRVPSGHAPHREDIDETVARNLERLEHERLIELDIRVETPPGPVLREQRECIGGSWRAGRTGQVAPMQPWLRRVISSA